LAKILKPNGSKNVKFGEPIAIMVTKPEFVKLFSDYTLEEE